MTSQQAGVGNDLLAKQLMDCAILVKKGQRGPILNETIQQLIEYVTASAAPPAAAAQQQPQRPLPSVAAAAGSTNHNQTSSTTNTTVGKHISPLMAMSKLVGLSTTVDDSHSARPETSKKATSQKNADRVKNDLAGLRVSAQQQQPLPPAANKSQKQQQPPPSSGKTTRLLPGLLPGHHTEGEWCDEHFTMGCQCKQRRGSVGGGGGTPLDSATTRSSTSSVSSQQQQQPLRNPPGGRKPPFQRPVNPKSTLVANGWIEQQRRSKMRTTWKLVLASLVEGRNAGEETTLWIQREVTGSNGKPQLEALHQIPIKWITDIEYSRYSAEGKFTLKVHSLNDEFTFRTKDEDSAQNWVLTLRSAKEGGVQRSMAASSSEASATALDQEWDGPRNRSTEEEKKERGTPPPRRSPPRPQTYEEPATGPEPSPDSRRPDHPPPPPPPSHKTAAAAAGIPPPATYTSAAEPPSPSTNGVRMSVKELRAIAHGAGVSTIGMERSQLEAVVAHILHGSSSNNSNAVPQATPAAATAPAAAPPIPPAATPSPPPPPPKAAAPPPQTKTTEESELERLKKAEEDRKKKVAEEKAAVPQAAAAAELARRRAEEEAATALLQRQEAEEAKRAEEDRHRRIIAERVQEQQETERKKREEEERRRAEEERLRREEEEHRRRVAEQQAAEHRRRQEEAIRLQQQQWQAVQNQQAEELRRRQAEEQRMAEQHRMQEEAYRRQQQWNPQQHPGHQYPPQQHHGPPPPQQQQQQQWHQQQQRPPYPMPQGPGFVPPPGQFHYGAQQQQHPGVRPTGHAVPPPPPPQPFSPINKKYATMASQTTDDLGQTIHTIKHGVLVNWALQPPLLQTLRPIEVLLSTVHNVFPPSFGVPGHEYFSKWSPITPEDVTTTGNRPDTDKLSKSIRKLRFFLHPDKLPRDLSDEQKFMCKMVWDITSDAYEDHKKKEEELGWIRT